MKKAKAVRYNAHKYYNVMIDTDLLNMKIRIFDENFHQTGTIFYEGTVGKFMKERVPTESLVELLIELKHKDKLSYRLSDCENFIERIR
jgi:hypothetical protein